ncbi:hypothetical protein FGRA07_11107 [Fusarium graminearum]|nr:hypothetical protein FGRA07_11107 [Fusarium graminearum]
MKTSIAIISASVASVMASPFPISTKQCNVVPSAAVNGNVHPFHNGKADTAVDCQTDCASDDSCKSFAFGLVKGAHQPSCLLFEVPAAKVPARNDGLHVFDKECAADRVPTSAPTTAQPWGTVPKKVLVRRATQCNCAATGSADNSVQPFKTTTAATAKDCQALAEADTSCLSFLYGLSGDSKSPVCKLYKVAASKIPARSDSLFIFDKGCSSKQVPTTAPTEDAPRGLVSVSVKVTKGDNKNEYQDTKTEASKNDEHKEAVKPKSTKVQISQPKATKVAKVENGKDQYAQPTKVSNPKTKVTKIAEVENKNETQDNKVKDTVSKGTKVEDTKAKGEDNKQAKATKVQGQQHQTTKIAEVENNKDNKGQGNNNKDAKVEGPKTLVTKVRNNEQQATQATKADGKKSECKTTKTSNAQPKVTQAY